MKLNYTKTIKAFLMLTLPTYAVISCRSTYPTITDSFTADAGKADIAHGEALVMSSCGGCHYVASKGRLMGRKMDDMPKIAGKVYSANLTASKKYSPVPHYSDAELAYLLRTGIKRDGHFVPYMLRPNMSDKDIRDIIAYLRSGKGHAAPTDTVAGHSKLNFIGKWSLHIIGKPQPYRQSIPHPQTEVELGRYLVDNIGCFHCHSKKVISLNYLYPEKTKGYLAGGAKFKKPGGGKIRGANITLDYETGIGAYSKADFRRAVQHAKAPGNRSLRPPMEAFHLTDAEADAIFAYLNTIPRVHHKVKSS